MLVMLALGLLAAANDIFHVGHRLGGAGIPFSAFFAILVDGFIIVVVGGRLVGTDRPRIAIGRAALGFGLTLRESEILPLLLEGASNEEIGESLHISPHTVKNHISVIFRKTGARNRFDLLKTFNSAATD